MPDISGLKLIVASSINGSGVSLSDSGKITFSSTTSIGINDCFSSDYKQYILVMYYTSTSANPNINLRLRSSGTDASSTNYNHQALYADGSSYNSNRATSQAEALIGGATTGQANSLTMYIYDPFSTQSTSGRSITVRGTSGCRLQDHTWAHTLSSSYDGLSIIPSSDSISGNLTIYGLSR